MVVLQAASGVDPITATLVGAIIAAFVGTSVVSWLNGAATRRDVTHLAAEVRVLNDLHPPSHGTTDNPVPRRHHRASDFCGLDECLERAIPAEQQGGPYVDEG